MKVLFMGTPDFAVSCLERLILDGHEVSAVVSQADKPKGRGHKTVPTPVKECALKNGIEVYQPETLKDFAFKEELEKIAPEVIVVVAYGRILPEYILNYPKYGCINIHGSLLPKYRGAAPIQRAIINGEKKTGVTAMFMEKGLDTGDMILKKETEIKEGENAEELFCRLSLLGAEALSETLKLLKDGDVKAEKQNDAESTYAEMLTKETGSIDWNKTQNEIINLIRGAYAWPVAYTKYKGENLKIYVAEGGGGQCGKRCGEIISADKNGLLVACGGGGAVLVKEAQFFGSKRMNIGSYLNGHDIDLNAVLGE